MTRIFIGPVEIAGVAQGLTAGLRLLGVDARLMLSTPHPFKYGALADSWMLRVWQRMGAARNRTSNPRLLRKLLLVALHDTWGWLVLLQAVFRFDAFIFLYGQTCTNSRAELWLLRRLKKKIVFVYAGSDSRPPYMDGSRFPGQDGSDLPSAQKLWRATRRCRRKLQLQERYADAVVNSPASGHFHNRPFINWFAMGLPKTPQTTEVEAAASTSGGVRIVHAPSNPAIKGTARIVDAVGRLRSRGLSVELVMLQGQPNHVVMQELARCDLVVDQLYSDTPLAALATEAATLGKPTLVAGYFAEHMNRHVVKGFVPPSLFVLPDALDSALEQLVVDPAYRHRLGAAARDFVATHWHPAAVARRYMQLLEYDIPEEWWCDPENISYVQGCGLPAARTRSLMQRLIGRFGACALGVDDKPGLKQAMLDFCASRERQHDH